MSTIKANDLQSASGGIPTVKGQRLIPTAWVNFNPSTSTINDSEGVSSITNISAAADTINFTTVMVSSNYAVVGASNGSTTGINAGRMVCPYNMGTNSVSIVNQQAYNSAASTPLCCVAILGGQA